MSPQSPSVTSRYYIYLTESPVTAGSRSSPTSNNTESRKASPRPYLSVVETLQHAAPETLVCSGVNKSKDCTTATEFRLIPVSHVLPPFWTKMIAWLESRFVEPAQDSP